jgi:Rrf2 family protein
VRISAKVDYAVRATVELTGAAQPLKAEEIATRQDIPVRFLLTILGQLKLAGVIESRRGSDGGYWLHAPAEEVTIADVIRAVEGPLADVHGLPPEEIDYPEPAGAVREVWVATRAALRGVLERVTIADVAAGQLPPEVRAELAKPDAWRRR